MNIKRVEEDAFEEEVVTPGSQKKEQSVKLPNK